MNLGRLHLFEGTEDGWKRQHLRGSNFIWYCYYFQRVAITWKHLIDVILLIFIIPQPAGLPVLLAACRVYTGMQHWACRPLAVSGFNVIIGVFDFTYFIFLLIIKRNEVGTQVCRWRRKNARKLLCHCCESTS